MLAAGVLVLLPGCGESPSAEAFHTVERRPFSISMPDWPAETDDDSGLGGRYKLRRGQRIAELNWNADRSSDAAALKDIADATMASVGVRDYWHSVDEAPGQLRLHLRHEVKPGVWLSMSMVRCLQPGVTVSLSTVDATQEAAERLRVAMLDSLTCSSDDLSDLRPQWPVSDLPADFGVQESEELLLAHADGRWLRVVAMPTGQVETLRGEPGMAATLLRAMGGLLGMQVDTDGRAEDARNLSGAASVWRMRVRPEGTLVASAFTCWKARSGYLVLAADLNGRTSLRELNALSLRFGCPGRSSGQPLLEGRTGICEAGAAEFCEAIGGSPAKPAGDAAPAD